MGAGKINTMNDLGGPSGNQTLLLVQLQFEFKTWPTFEGWLELSAWELVK